LGYKYKTFQKSPNSYILLVCYTISHSYLIAVIILFYKVETIYQAAATTAGMFVVLTAYAVYTKGDMQLMGAGLSAAVNSLFWLIMFIFIWGASKILYLIIAVIVVILMAVFIVYDTRLIVGNQHKKFCLDLDDYAIGAVILYSDIITMFIYLL
jgi:FtsH-binding integral membrane protein